MTAFWVNKSYYELTLFNNEIVAFSLSNKKGDPNSYHIGLAHLISKKEENYKKIKPETNITFEEANRFWDNVFASMRES